MCDAAAKSGMLVVAIDTTLSHEAPYPASVQDVNYGVRWLKSRAREWNGDASMLGLLGSSSGGHVAELVGMRPRDPRYTAIPLPEAPNTDATVAYIATRSPISDCHARYENTARPSARKWSRRTRCSSTRGTPSSKRIPQLILSVGEKVTLPPLLIMQGELDYNVPWQIQEKFAQAWRTAGGECELEIFKGCEHMWIHDPGPQTDRAHEILKAFIARQLKALRKAA